MVMNSFTDRTIRLHLVPLVGLLSLSLAWSGSVFADEVEDTAEEAEYSRGANQCMVCHREGRDNAAHEIFFGQMGISDSQDSPFADGRHDCETCHGPGSEYMAEAVMLDPVASASAGLVDIEVLDLTAVFAQTRGATWESDL